MRYLLHISAERAVPGGFFSERQEDFEIFYCYMCCILLIFMQLRQ